MRWTGMAAGVLALTASLVGSARAGLYNSAEPPAVLSRNFRTFQDTTLIPLLQIAATKVTNPQKNAEAIEVNSPLKKRAELIAALGARASPTALGAEQRLDLSAYLVRLGKFREAINVLAPAQYQERDNFLVLSNLATAEHLDGQSRRARDYLADALRLWPSQWSGLSKPRRQWLEQIGWQENDFRWYREVEGYQLKLLRLRAKAAPGPANELPGNVDGIFDDEKTAEGKIQFVGASGRYEAGKIAPAERAKLPKNALEIVEQLLVWMPYDPRLYWLLGELFNAEGDVPAALASFREAAVKWDPSVAPEFDSAGAVPGGFKREAALPRLFKEHLAVLRAHPKAELTIVDSAPAPATPPATVGPPQDGAPPVVDGKSLGVGFGVGLVVAFLASWQLREIRRRRHAGSVP